MLLVYYLVRQECKISKAVSAILFPLLYFKLVGIVALDSVDVYIKTYFLKDKSDTLNGVFSGIDNENRLVNGNVLIEYLRV